MWSGIILGTRWCEIKYNRSQWAKSDCEGAVSAQTTSDLTVICPILREKGLGSHTPTVHGKSRQWSSLYELQLSSGNYEYSPHFLLRKASYWIKDEENTLNSDCKSAC